MRVRPLVLIFALAAVACRPPSDADSPPNEAVPDEHEANEADEGKQASTPRPENSIYRSEIVRATQGGSPAYLLAQLSPEPYRPQGRFEGWVITRVWPSDTDLCAPGCDLYPGDIIMTVNGSRLETPESLSALLERMIEFETIEVSGIRNGEFYEHSYAILPDPALPD